ncbi:accessory Sec system protein Asp3 [Fructobacillus sp. M1-13]|uniref:Accessory Sec system protein Asp3 n=1 Tax=Fructobacillus papyriferae TaxID=2713171 RepID=A0ABS5QNE5_9LACO|nr:accessory Sec system protein Asp3 [Fructobacillus papyriferae]MBS9334526.1 accessory Sec system protein Asp3 [Fructobacillus papyriferae]MCD2158515.1 accessory Sec system protein Asp3 [Fructobacillus papyriferae]
MQSQIYWTPKTKLHELQGAVVDFIKEDEVFYQNYFLPSGQTIVSWTDSANYFQEKRIGQLPRLEKQRRYRSKMLIHNSARMRAYLAWNFFDKKGELISQHFQNSPEDTFLVPEGYESYQIELRSAGTGSFTFKEIQLAPVVDGVLLDGDQAVSDHLAAYLELPEVLTEKTLRVVLKEPVFDTMDYPKKRMQPSPQAVLYLATDLMHCQSYYDERVLEVINQAKKAAKAKDVEFVGYGPISALTALLYRQAVKGATAVIPKQADLKLPSGYRRHSKGLADFIASLPEKIKDLRLEEEAVLKTASLSKAPSQLQAPTVADEMLSSLSYPAWPVDKKAEKKKKAQEKAAAEEEKKAARAEEKKAKRLQEKQEKQEKQAPKKKKGDPGDEKNITVSSSTLKRSSHRHGLRQHQLDKTKKEEKPSSSQLLQDFFTKNRS